MLLLFLFSLVTDAKLDKFGLWTYCFRSLPHLNDTSEQSYLVGCHWIFNPFTEEYNEIEGFLLPRKNNNDNNIYVIIIGGILSAFYV